MLIKKYIALIALTGLVACSRSNQQSEKSNTDTTANAARVVSAQTAFKDEKINLVYTNYLTLKDALVATNFKEATAAAKQLSQNIGQLDKSFADDAVHIADAKTIEVQRNEFTNLSKHMIALLKKSELASGTVFVQHCPMANQGDGGDWLSSAKNIQNPYYGSEMMECGAVVEEIKATKK